MCRTLEEHLVEQCAPTLTGLKPASLFRCRGNGPRPLSAAVAEWTDQLARKGICLRVLKVCPCTGDYMLYLYRKGWLGDILAAPENRAFLTALGYGPAADVERDLDRLASRLCLEGDYPHEIGVFLGYPLEDVVGFIEHRGRNFTCTGYWKAYGDPETARRRFDGYRRCTAWCREKLRRGAAWTELISA